MRRKLWIVWGALLTSVAVYLCLALAGITLGAAEAPTRALVPVFASLAVSMAVASVVLRRRLLEAPIRERRLDPGTREGAQCVVGAYVAIWALCEAIAVWGFVLWLSSGQWGLFLPFLGGSVAMLALHAPRDAELVTPRTTCELASRPEGIG